MRSIESPRDFGKPDSTSDISKPGRRRRRTKLVVGLLSAAVVASGLVASASASSGGTQSSSVERVDVVSVVGLDGSEAHPTRRPDPKKKTDKRKPTASTFHFAAVPTMNAARPGCDLVVEPAYRSQYGVLTKSGRYANPNQASLRVYLPKSKQYPKRFEVKFRLKDKKTKKVYAVTVVLESEGTENQQWGDKHYPVPSKLRIRDVWA